MKKIIFTTLFVLFCFLPASLKAEIKTISEGSVDAKIKIIVFESLTCSHCANFHKNVYPGLKEDFIDKGHVYIEFKNFPLDKVIIIIRNPLDVFVSLINYYDISKDKIDDLVDFFCVNYTLPRFKNFPNWYEHLDGWVNSNLKFGLFKYSELLDDFDNQIIKLANFLNIKVDNTKIQMVKKNTSFEKLKKIEIFERNKKLNSFFNNDAMGLVKNSFMNVGKNHYYSSVLNKDQIDKLEKSFCKAIEKYVL